jgi:hypothetical protein
LFKGLCISKLVKLANFEAAKMPEKRELGQLGQLFVRMTMKDLIDVSIGREDSTALTDTRFDRFVLRPTSTIDIQTHSIVARPPREKKRGHSTF